MPNNNIQETFERLNELWEADEHRTKKLNLNVPYAILSDFHLGDGNGADNFRRNEAALIEALQYYKQRGFTLILLGDVEELWQFDFDEIRFRYDATIYRHLQGFPRQRLHRVFGNHDFEWGKLTDRTIEGNGHMYWACEAVKLGDHILATHGHQGDKHADENSWWYSRFGVRLFRFVEPLFLKLKLYNNSAALPQDTRDLNGHEKTLYAWAKEKQAILICGHTHRAIFASLSYAERLQAKIRELTSQIRAARRAGDWPNVEKLSKARQEKRKKLREEKRRKRMTAPMEPNGTPEPRYFNSGCGIYNDGITNLEIENNKIRLVKWSRESGPNGRRKVYQEADLRL